MVTLHCEVAINSSTKSCFVDLSRDVVSELYQDNSNDQYFHEPIVLSIESSEKCTFVTWSGKVYGFENKRTINLNRDLASLLSIYEHDIVKVQLRQCDIYYSSLVIVPLKEEEWEFLNINSSFLETELLNRIRVVQPGLTFPVYIRGNAVVIVKVCEVNPPAPYGYLTENTEVEIGFFNKKTCANEPPSTDQDSPSDMAIDDFGERKDYHTIDLMECSQRNIKQLLDNYKVTERMKRPFLEFFSSLFSQTPSLPMVEPVKATTASWELPLSGNRENTCFTAVRVCCFSEVVGTPPFLCYTPLKIFHKLVLEQRRSNHLDLTLKLVLRTMYSPTEIECAKENAEVIVDVRPWTKDNIASMDNFIMVPRPLLDFLRLTNGSLVQLLHCDASSVPMFGVLLVAREQRQSSLPDHGEVKPVRELYISWVNALKDKQENQEILLNEYTPVEIHTREGNATLLFKCLYRTDTKKGGPFCSLVTAEELLELAVDEPCWDQADDTLTSRIRSSENSLKSSVDSLGPGIELHDLAVNYCKEYVVLGNRCPEFMEHGAILICSASNSTASGCGRSSLAHAVAHTLSERPYYFYAKVIDCIPLRGKRPETVLEIWKKEVEEAKWHQPSILCFDDLDFLSERTEPSDQTRGVAFYSSRLSEMFCDLLKSVNQHGQKVFFLITSRSKNSLHSCVVHSARHLIHLTLQIQLPQPEERTALLMKISERMRCVLEDEDIIRNVVERSNGFVAGDLDTLVRRAIVSRRGKARKHKGTWMSCQDAKDVILSTLDFEEALNGFVPLSLRGVCLTKPGGLSFDQIGGLNDVKQVLIETFVWPIKYSNLFSTTSLRVATGVLLYGLPGTGKTMLARALAKESSLNLINIKGPELLSKYIGSSEQNVRDIFSKARVARPSLLFFDEFDALAPKRGHDSTGVTDRVVNQLLTEMDGVEALVGVYVLAATSRPDLIDSALLRPGRFDKSVLCPLPDERARMEILQVLAKDVSVSREELSAICSVTEGYTGADMKALLCNAQLEAFHRTYDRISDDKKANREFEGTDVHVRVSKEDLRKSLLKTPPSLPPEERRIFETRFRHFQGVTTDKETRFDSTSSRATLA